MKQGVGERICGGRLDNMGFTCEGFQLQFYDGGCRSLKLKGRLQSEQSPKRAGWSVRLGSRV